MRTENVRIMFKKNTTRRPSRTPRPWRARGLGVEAWLTSTQPWPVAPATPFVSTSGRPVGRPG